MQPMRLMDSEQSAHNNINDPVASAEQMQKIIRKVLWENEKYGIPQKGLPSPKKLIAEPKGKVAYDLRVTSPRYSIVGVAGRMSQLQFEGMVVQTLIHFAALNGTCLGGSWKPVAAKLEFGSRSKTQPVSTGVNMNAIGNVKLDPETGEVGDGPQRLKHVSVEQRDLVLHIVWAELTQADIICPTFEQTNRRVGKRYAFASSGGDVKRMSAVDSQLRSQAKDIIAWSYKLKSDAGVGVELDAETREKAYRYLVDFSMPPEEVSGALGMSVDRARALHAEFMSQAKPKKGKKKEKADAGE